MVTRAVHLELVSSLSAENILATLLRFMALTPGYFLVGESLMCSPKRDVTNVPQNRLRQFKLMQAAMQIFWEKWSIKCLLQIQR